MVFGWQSSQDQGNAVRTHVSAKQNCNENLLIRGSEYCSIQLKQCHLLAKVLRL